MHQKHSSEGSILERITKFKKSKIVKMYRNVCFSNQEGFKKIPIFWDLKKKKQFSYEQLGDMM